MTPSLRLGLAALSLVLGLDAAVLIHARLRARDADERSARAIVGLVGTADLALSSGARWLRHPSQVEPWAAVSDHPATLDTEPAGAVLGPPRP